MTIDNQEITPLSDEDLEHIIPGIKILKYSELSKYQDIDDVLPKPKDYCIIIYELAENSGHWTCLLKYDGIVEFMDPYGLRFDNELDWISNSAKQKLHEDHPLLST